MPKHALLPFITKKNGPTGKFNFILDKKKDVALDQFGFGLWIDEIITQF